MAHAAAAPPDQAQAALSGAACRQAYAPFLLQPDYLRPGPLRTSSLPRLEHTCVSCFPSCVGNGCLVRVSVTYPRGGADLGIGPPYPLAIFSAGFLVGSEAYASYAQRLASWGYTVMLYDRQEAVGGLLDDAAAVRVLVDLIDWAERDALLRRVADTRSRGVYLLGHSRGAKLAALAGAEDARVTALCLVDPVDNTVYAPLGPGYPSALAALRNMPSERRLPLAVVGSGLGGDCAPRPSNYHQFFTASQAPAWEVAIPSAGHMQYLDEAAGLQRAICPVGDAPDDAVRDLAAAVMVAWGEAVLRHGGRDVFRLAAPYYPAACAAVAPAARRGGSGGAQPLGLEEEVEAEAAATASASAAQLLQRQGLRGVSTLVQVQAAHVYAAVAAAAGVAAPPA